MSCRRILISIAQKVALVSLVAVSAHVWAQGNCGEKFSHLREPTVWERPWPGPPVLEAYERGLSPSLLARKGFRIGENRSLEKLNSDGSWSTVGTLMTIRTKHLFEWANDDVYSYLATHGADRRFMENILEQGPQLAGKGFYVSTHPYDSQYFGSLVTVFNVRKPLYVLELSSPQLGSDASFVKELASVGIDGLRIQGYHDKWISMIRGANLREVIDTPEDVLSWIFLKQIGGPNSSAAGHNVKAVYLDQWERLLKSDRRYLTVTRGVGTARTEKQLTALLLKVREGALPFPTSLDQVRRNLALAPSASRREKVYDSLLANYDLKDLARIQAFDSSDTIAALREMKANAASYLTKKKKIDLSKISSVDELIAAYKQIYGFDMEFRKMGVVMTNEGNPEQILPAWLVDRLQKRSQLKVFLAPTQPSDPALKRVVVSYHIPSPWDLKDAAENKRLVSQELYERARNSIEGDAVDPSHPDVAAVAEQIYRNYIGEYLRQDGVNHVRSTKQLLDAYVGFMEYHPFQDGNGRLGRLFFEVLETRANFPYSELRPKGGVSLPVFDLDLMGKPEQLEEALVMGAVTRAWIRQAKSDQEFLERVNVAASAMEKVNPELMALFPQLVNQPK